MIVGPGFSLIHIPKTGGRYAWWELQKTGQCRRPYGVHKRRMDVKIGSQSRWKWYAIRRNPYDWYVSWWAHLFEVDRRCKAVLWSPDFKATLRRLMRQESTHGMDSWPVFETMKACGIGYCTYRHVQSTQKADHMLNGKVEWPEDVLWLRSEQLWEDLCELYRAHRLPGRPSPTRHRPSPRERDWRTYYDDESAGWVAEADSEMLERFGFGFEGSPAWRFG